MFYILKYIKKTWHLFSVNQNSGNNIAEQWWTNVCCKSTICSLMRAVVTFGFEKHSGSDRLHFHHLIDSHAHRLRYSMASALLDWVSQVQMIQRENNRSLQNQDCSLAIIWAEKEDSGMDAMFYCCSCMVKRQSTNALQIQREDYIGLIWLISGRNQ